MARDQERGARIRALYADTKAQRPETTWRQIADAVGVSERAAAAWPKTGGISYDNAKKLAAFFKRLGHDVDVDYIWRGPESDVPDLMGTINGDRSSEERLATVERLVYENFVLLEAIAAKLDVSARPGAVIALQGIEQRLADQASQDPAEAPPGTSRRHRATGS